MNFHRVETRAERIEARTDVRFTVRKCPPLCCSLMVSQMYSRKTTKNFKFYTQSAKKKSGKKI